MFINVETRKKLCRIGKKLKTKEGLWMVRTFVPKKPGRPKQIVKLRNGSSIQFT